MTKKELLSMIEDGIGESRGNIITGPHQKAVILTKKERAEKIISEYNRMKHFIEGIEFMADNK